MPHTQKRHRRSGPLRSADAGAARRAGSIAVITAAALWGLGGTLAGELFERGADPLEVVAVRTWVALLGLGALALRRRAPIPARQVPWRLVIGFGLSVSVANAALFLAIERLPVAVALVLQSLAPAFVIVGALVLTGRVPSPRVLAWLIAALAGVALVVELPTAPLGDIDLPGVAFGLLTAVGVAAFSVLGGRAAQSGGALAANIWGFAVAGGVWLVIQTFRGLPALFDQPWLLAGAVLISVFGTLVPFLLYTWGTARVGAQAGAVSMSLEPMFGAGLAWLWLGQALAWLQWAGTAVLVVAVVFLQRPEHPPPAGPPSAGSRVRGDDTQHRLTSHD
ncbi:EamA family transporter [Streptomyces sp. NPDC101151]|uniref:EamA family transporter n=1 Tax=Streptomyces sp. NPDC101151 TaxID=3366115 RepID=UPI0038231BB9